MPSIINASSTGSGGIVQTADASGVLQLQSNGTLALTTNGSAIGIGGIVTPTFPLVVQTSSTSTAVAGNIIARFQSLATGYDASIQFSDNVTNSGFISMNSGNMIIGSFGTESIRFKSGGTVVLQNGSTSATGIGITFPASQSASTNANTLDDYEEGTYTASLTPSSGSISMAGAENTGYYVKIGRMVMVTGRITAASVSSPSGELNINLPFTIANITQQATALAGSIFVWNAAAGASTNGLWTLFSDIGQANLFARYGNSTTPGGGAGFIQANTEVRFTAVYVAAS